MASSPRSSPRRLASAEAGRVRLLLGRAALRLLQDGRTAAAVAGRVAVAVGGRWRWLGWALGSRWATAAEAGLCGTKRGTGLTDEVLPCDVGWRIGREEGMAEPVPEAAEEGRTCHGAPHGAVLSDGLQANGEVAAAVAAVAVARGEAAIRNVAGGCGVASSGIGSLDNVGVLLAHAADLCPRPSCSTSRFATKRSFCNRSTSHCASRSALTSPKSGATVLADGTLGFASQALPCPSTAPALVPVPVPTTASFVASAATVMAAVEAAAAKDTVVVA